MPNYLFKCSSCDDLKRCNLSVKEFKEKKDSIKCDKCSNEMSRCFEKTFSFKIDKTSQEIIDEIQRDKEKILDKFNQGDIKTISDICGE